MEACEEGLAEELKDWAKYGGWNLDNIRSRLTSLEKNKTKNAEFETDMFHGFEVNHLDFTIKNGI